MPDSLIARTFPPLPSLAESWSGRRVDHLAAAGADPVDLLHKALKTLAHLREHGNDMVRYKAAYAELEIVGAFAPQPVQDATPRFSVSIALAGQNDTVINTMTVIGSSSAESQGNQAFASAAQGLETVTQGSKHNGLGYPDLGTARIEGHPAPPKLRRAPAARGGSQRKKPSHESLAFDTTEPIVPVRSRRCSRCQGEGHYAKTCKAHHDGRGADGTARGDRLLGAIEEAAEDVEQP